MTPPARPSTRWPSSSASATPAAPGSTTSPPTATPGRYPSLSRKSNPKPIAAAKGPPDAPYLFSFSGIKTAVLRYVETPRHGRLDRSPRAGSSPHLYDPAMPSPSATSKPSTCSPPSSAPSSRTSSARPSPPPSTTARTACSSPAAWPLTANCALDSPQQQRTRPAHRLPLARALHGQRRHDRRRRMAQTPQPATSRARLAHRPRQPPARRRIRHSRKIAADPHEARSNPNA